MATPIKLYEIKGEDFAKGLSYSEDFPINGIFSSYNADPFQNYGYFSPVRDDERVDNLNSTIPRFFTSFTDSGTKYVYAHGDTSLYRILDGTPFTGTSKSAEIDVTSRCTGAIIWKGKYIYAQSEAPAEIYSNNIAVAGASNVKIIENMASSSHWTPMAVAPDKNLYFGNAQAIGQITVTTVVPNANTYNYYSVESGFYVRDLVSDGHYLIAIADNNVGHITSPDGADLTGNYRCIVLFYDVNNGRSTADYIYEFTDSYLSSVKVLDGAVYIFGRDNLWVCNSQTAPKAIFNFQDGSTIIYPPICFNEVTQKNNLIYWIGSNGTIYSFGTKYAGTKKVFSAPFSPGNSTAITTSGEYVYIGFYNSGAVYSETVVQNYNSALTSSTLETTPIHLSQPFKFSFAKVSFKNHETTWTVSLGMTTRGSKEVVDTTTKSSAQLGAKHNVIFNPASDSGNPAVQTFDDFKLSVSSNVELSKIEIWGTPVDNYEQI